MKLVLLLFNVVENSFAFFIVVIFSLNKNLNKNSAYIRLLYYVSDIAVSFIPYVDNL